MADALEVETPVGGQVMRFSYAGHSEREAVDGANGAAESYLELRKGMYENQRAAVLKSYDDTIDLVTAQRATTQRSLPANQSSSNPSPRTSALLDQLRALNDQLATLAEQRSKVASADLSPGSVTSAARSPVPSSRDAASLLLVAGLLAGLLLGGLVAFVQESLDRRVRTAAEAVATVGAPLLGTVRRRRGGQPDDSDLRYLVLALGRWVDGPQRTPLVVLSSATDEGREEVTAGLAVVLAAAGHDVRLGVTPESLDRIRPLMLDAQRRNPPVEPVRSRPLPRPRPVPATTPATTAAAGPEDTAVIPASASPDRFPPPPRRRTARCTAPPPLRRTRRRSSRPPGRRPPRARRPTGRSCESAPARSASSTWTAPPRTGSPCWTRRPRCTTSAGFGPPGRAGRCWSRPATGPDVS
ncbi:hypothetical protein [Micromonospora sp. 4G55]|uniref:hypothetical protein n=1 Tax=Micromonospora sp. 4G55 TaxID=2806102 RepID=UPI001A4418BC|nr:hypothetical protein [Micromonospora sp. 4G55]MBM0258785.1 hypothetical protein [Micromonospora sp. 4G55]